MIQRELARREEARATFLPYCYTVHDEPGAMTNVAAAVQAVEEEHEIRVGKGEGKAAPTIAPTIADAVEEALAAAHPKHFARLGRLSIVSHVIVDSKTRHEPVPEAIDEGHTVA